MVLSDVLALLLVGLGPAGVTGRLLFDFQALVHAFGKEAFLAIWKVPDFANLLDFVAHFDGFAEFGRASGPT